MKTRYADILWREKGCCTIDTHIHTAAVEETATPESIAEWFTATFQDRKFIAADFFHANSEKNPARK